jgi:DeoR/GlpR family transcriptional regulator of sugar metabolism
MGSRGDHRASRTPPAAPTFRSVSLCPNSKLSSVQLKRNASGASVSDVIVPSREAAFGDERQATIAEYVTTRGRARITELAAMTGVTEVTVRKDLRALQDRGVLKRTHGGAIALTPLVERELAGRQASNQEAKAAIARRCAELVGAGESVFLDSGTSVDAVAQALLADPVTTPANLTVLTNALSVVERTAEAPGVDHVLLGGELRRSSRSLVGPLALHCLQRFTVGIAFIGVSGFAEGGISVSSVGEAEVKACAIENARKVVVPLEHTKVGATDFARICGLDEIDVVVMDKRVPAVEDLCAAHGVELLIANE